MTQTAAHRSYVGSRAATSRRGLCPACRSTGHRPGFTLIELVVAMAILLIVVVGVLSSVLFAYNSSNDTELRNTAKNLASYTLEYLRSRTVTRGTSSSRLTALGITSSSTGTYGWYDASTNANGAFPSMIDVGDLPLQSNGWPCNYTSTYVRTGGQVDGSSNPGSGGGIGAGGIVFKFASKHAAKVADPVNLIAADTYADQPLAFTSTLQGYVSVRDMTAPSSTQNPAPEDGNLARMLFSGSNVASGTYRTTLTDLTPTGAWTDLIVRYPNVYVSAAQPGIKSFTSGATYLAKVYTTDANRVDKSNQEYNPYYTTSQKAATQDYRGFRVLTQVVARATGPIVAGFRHVQYYDVTVTVLWMSGTRESNYELVSRIVAY